MTDKHSMSWNTEILPCGPESLKLAVELLHKGELVAVPTETVYGLAGNATDTLALGKIFAAKGRPLNNPLIVHVPLSFRSVIQLSKEGLLDDTTISPKAHQVLDQLILQFWPGPLTLIAPRGRKIPLEATAGGSSVALRQSSHPDFQQLLDLVGTPLAAPSANQSNRISPTSARHVFEELQGRIPLILDGGPCTIGLESTVLQALTDGSIRILRHGAISLDDLKNSGYHVSPQDHQTVPTPSRQPVDSSAFLLSPGQLPVHYAPRSPLYLIPPARQTLDKFIQDTGLIQLSLQRSSNLGKDSPTIVFIPIQSETLLWWQENLKDIGTNSVTTISPSRLDDPQTIARELFGLLRQADQLKPLAIVVDHPPETGSLWPAIFDRLKRASRNHS